MTTLAQLENDSLYIFLKLRSSKPGDLDMGFFVPTDKPVGHTWTVCNNDKGEWKMEHQIVEDLPSNSYVALFYKIGLIDSLKEMRHYMRMVPAGGATIKQNEVYASSVWLTDAVYFLHASEVIKLKDTKRTRHLVYEAVTNAERNRENVERGIAGAVVCSSNFTINQRVTE